MSGYALAFLSFLVFLVQSSVMPFFFSGLHQPDLWLVVIVLATLIFDNKTAMALALVGGLLTDLVTGNLFGLHLLPYLAIAALYLALGRKRYNRAGLAPLCTAVMAGAFGSRQPCLLDFLYPVLCDEHHLHEWSSRALSSQAAMGHETGGRTEVVNKHVPSILSGLLKNTEESRYARMIYAAIFLLLVLGLRLFYMQVIQGGYYKEEADGNRIRYLPMQAMRGVMYDRNGLILAGSRSAYSVVMPVDRKGNTLSDEALSRLSQLLHVPTADIKKKIEDNKLAFGAIYLANDVGIDVATQIE